MFKSIKSIYSLNVTTCIYISVVPMKTKILRNTGYSRVGKQIAHLKSIYS